MRKKRPFLLASLTLGGIFLFFLLVVMTAGLFRDGSSVVSVGAKVGILEVTGPIEGSRDFIRQIDNFREQGSIKAVVLRINSPGGAVGPAQEIYAELNRLAAAKPLIVSMGSVAASGGYYLALAGERLFANPGTITGSIGVIMTFPDYRQLMEKVGVDSQVIKSGRYKDIGSATREMSESERLLLEQMIDDVHQQFVEVVSEQRQLSPEQLKPYVDGRIMTGRQARQAGLLDEIGTFNDAVAYAARIAGLDPDPDLVHPQREKINFWERYLPEKISRVLAMPGPNFPALGPQYLWNGY
jgi:protease-4